MLLFCIHFQYWQKMYVPLHSVAKTSGYPCLTYNIHLYVHILYCAVYQETQCVHADTDSAANIAFKFHNNPQHASGTW
jgi:hypothetical protein